MRLLRSLLAAGFAVTLLGAYAGVALAGDPAEVTFGSPQLLVWWDGHSTYDGPVTDNVYALILPDQVDPDDATHFIIADGSGGWFHYRGHIVSGPYNGGADLCPVMIANAIDYLNAYPYSQGVGVSLADCQAAAATPAPTPTEEPAATADPALLAGGGTTTGANPGSGSDVAAIPGDTTDPGDDPLALAIAIGIICLALGIGGVMTLRHLGMGALTVPPSPLDPGAPPPDDPGGTAVTPDTAPDPDQPTRGPQQRTDPCASQQRAFEAASAHARGLNSVLATLRSFAARIDQEIVRLEDGAIPTEMGVEIAFAAGSLGGATLGGAGFVPETIAGKIVENVIRDAVKDVIKISVNAGTLAAGGALDTATAAGQSALEATFKGMMEQQLSNDFFAAQIKGAHSPFELARELPARFAAADTYAGHAAEALGQLMTAYNCGANLAQMMAESAILRTKAVAIHGDIADVESDLEDALNAMRDTRARLDHCRLVNSPDWRP